MALNKFLLIFDELCTDEAFVEVTLTKPLPFISLSRDAAPLGGRFNPDWMLALLLVSVTLVVGGKVGCTFL